MDQQTLLSQLVQREYVAQSMRLRATPLYLTAERAVERIELADGRRWVLRGFHGDEAATERELRGQAAVLAHLARCGYVAPQVVRTRQGEVVASRNGWTALVLSWTAGAPAGFGHAALERLGAAASALHAQPIARDGDEDGMPLPDCRLRPPATLPAFAPAAHLPPALRPIYDAWVAALRRMCEAAPRLPLALLHGDCWLGNALVADDGSLALIDWDGAGLGPAVLDLGYLLLTCHLGQHDPFALHADPTAIAAVVRGYCRRRPLSANERDALGDAVRYDLARRAVLDGELFARLEHWETDPQVRKWLAREAIAGEVAALARTACEREISSR